MIPRVEIRSGYTEKTVTIAEENLKIIKNGRRKENKREGEKLLTQGGQ